MTARVAAGGRLQATPPGLAAQVEPEPVAAYAGLVTRTLAFAADALVIDLVGWLVGGVFALALSVFHLPHPAHSTVVDVGAVAWVLWSAGYFVVFWSTSGQTPGDRLMRVRVQDAASGRPPGPLRAIARLAGLVLAVVIVFVGVLWILVDARRRGLHDILAGTVVADLGARRPGSPT